jgi:signal transduction histidine kinase
LHRAVENVVRNAVKHTAEGSTVKISLSRSGNAAILHVRDYGPGIAPEHLDHVFEPFYRAGVGTGFGLGLAIAQGAVAAHGGAIRAENAAGGGLLIEIQLPSL